MSGGETGGGKGRCRADSGKAPPRGLPWDELMAFGLGVLRWPPETFWAATPAELLGALAAMAPPRSAAPGRATLEALMARFPDAAGMRATAAGGATGPVTTDEAERERRDG